jgi:hypothetical protein
MLRRFLKLCLFVAVVLLVPYYLSIVILGSEGAPSSVVVIWCVGLVIILFAIVCIALLVAAYKYVVNERW